MWLARGFPRVAAKRDKLMTVLGMMVTVLVPLAGFAGFFLADREVRPHAHARDAKPGRERAVPPSVVAANDIDEALVVSDGPALRAPRPILAQIVSPLPLAAD
jgi:hypothetical protein